MSQNESETLVLNKTKIFDAENCYIYQLGGTESNYWHTGVLLLMTSLKTLEHPASFNADTCVSVA